MRSQSYVRTGRQAPFASRRSTSHQECSGCHTVAVVVGGMLVTLAIARDGLAHQGIDAAAHQDPELVGTAWAQAHMLIQWVHMVAYGSWFGVTAAVLLLKASDLPLKRLLPLNWLFLLILLGSGSYNMQASGALPDPPDLFYLGVNEEWDFGASYTWLMTGKFALYGATVLVTFWASLIESKGGSEAGSKEVPGRLRRRFLVGQTALGGLIVIATAGVLFLHEAVDISPTPLHSLGGVVGPLGAGERVAAMKARTSAGEPYARGMAKGWDAGFLLLKDPRALGDLAGRAIHLSGFGLWLGMLGIGLASSRISPRRFLGWAWGLLALQMLSGIYGMRTWVPFDRSPYFWRLEEMVHYRFGWTYTALMATKHALIACVVFLLLGLTFVQVRNRRPVFTRMDRRLIGAMLFLTLILAYVMVAILLAHEGVDHAL